jgi:hypothetical protein
MEGRTSWRRIDIAICRIFSGVGEIAETGPGRAPGRFPAASLRFRTLQPAGWGQISQPLVAVIRIPQRGPTILSAIAGKTHRSNAAARSVANECRLRTGPPRRSSITFPPGQLTPRAGEISTSTSRCAHHLSRPKARHRRDGGARPSRPHPKRPAVGPAADPANQLCDQRSDHRDDILIPGASVRAVTLAQIGHRNPAEQHAIGRGNTSVQTGRGAASRRTRQMHPERSQRHGQSVSTVNRKCTPCCCSPSPFSPGRPVRCPP